jgi:hypothetical protein
VWNCKYFATYLHDDKKEVQSIATGIITPDGNMTILNTATLPHLRRQGFVEATIAGLIDQISNPEYGVKRISASLSSGVNKSTFQATDEDLKGIISSINNNASKLRKSEVDENLVQQYGEAIARILVAANNEKSDLEKEIADKLLGSNLWEKTNFKMMQNFIGQCPESSNPAFHLELGSPSGNINLIPQVFLTRELTEYCQKKIRSILSQKHDGRVGSGIEDWQTCAIPNN